MNYAPTNVKPELGLDQVDLGRCGTLEVSNFFKSKSHSLDQKGPNFIKFPLVGNFN